MRSTSKVYLTLALTILLVVPLTFYAVTDLSATNASPASFIPATADEVVLTHFNNTTVYVYRTPGNLSNNTGAVLGISLNSLYTLSDSLLHNASVDNKTTVASHNETGNILNISFRFRYDGYAIFHITLNRSAFESISINASHRLYNNTNLNNEFSCYLLNGSFPFSFVLSRFIADNNTFVSQDSSSVITLGSLHSVELSVKSHMDHKSFSSSESRFFDPGANISLFYNVSNNHFSLLVLNIYDNSSKLFILTQNKTFETYIAMFLTSNLNLSNNATAGNGRVSATLEIGLRNYQSIVIYLPWLYSVIVGKQIK